MQLADNSKNCPIRFRISFETINTAASIDKLLFTCEERVARGANLYTKSVFNRTCLKSIPASARYLTNRVIRMNCFFHYLSPLSALSLKRTQSKWHNPEIITRPCACCNPLLLRGNQPFWTCHSSWRNMGIRSDHNTGQLVFKNLNHLLHAQDITLSRRN